MCEKASFVMTRNDVLWCEDDSHESIIKKYALDDRSDSPYFVRAEIVPPDRDYRLSIDKWIYRVDQDYLPEWYNAEEAENAVRRELINWHKHKVITGKTVVIKDFGCKTRIFIDCVVDISGQTGGYVRAHGGKVVKK